MASAASILILVRLGHRALLGRALTLPQIRRLLAPVPLQLVANTIARISSLLENVPHAEAPQVQRRILDGLAPQLGPRVYHRLDREHARRGGAAVPAPIMFEDIPLRMVYEIALTNTEPIEPVGPEEGHLRIVRAILACNDHVRDDSFLAPRPVRFIAAGLERWAHLEFVSQLARYADSSGDGIARTYDILHRRYLATGHAGAARARKALEQATGCDVDTFWALLFALQAQQRSLDADRVATTHAWLSVASFSTGEFAFPPSQVEGILSLLARTDTEARQAALVRHARHLPPAYDNALLFVKPLLRMGDRVCAPLARLLYAKLSFGLHFTLQFLLPRADRDGFQRDVGTAFETYLADVMTRLAQQSDARIATGTTLYAALGASDYLPKLCDGLLFSDRGVILWDAKTAYGNEELFGGSIAAFRDYYNRHVNRIAAQFASTIDLIRRGAFESIGLRRDSDIVAMLMVPWLPLPSTPNLARYVRRLAEPVEPGVDWRALSVVRPSVLEGLEPCVSPEASAIDAMRAYRDSNDMDTGLNNFLLHLPFPGYGTRRNPYLQTCFAEATDRLHRVFTSRRAV